VKLGGPRCDEVVALEKGQGLKKLFSFVYFWNSCPLLSVHVDVSSDYNMRQFLHFYSVE
jgi:hypothetical protein